MTVSVMMEKCFKRKEGDTNIFESSDLKFLIKKLSKWKIVHILIREKLLTDYKEWFEIFNSKEQPISLLDTGV